MVSIFHQNQRELLFPAAFFHRFRPGPGIFGSVEYDSGLLYEKDSSTGVK